MKFTIIGSGGCVCLPKPTCRCPVCVEARAKGGRYKRHSASLYLEDAPIDYRITEPAPYESYDEYLWFIERMREELL